MKLNTLNSIPDKLIKQAVRKNNDRQISRKSLRLGMKQTLAAKLWEFFKQLITLSIPLFFPRNVITGFTELFEFIDDLLDISSFYGARKRGET